MNVGILQQRQRKRILPPGMRIPLTPVEVEILQWLSKGKRYDDIAQILEMSTNSVHQQMHRLLNKLCTNTAAGAVGTAMRRKLIE